ALQSGDASFMLSGGIIFATPHAVKITNDIPKDVFRVTYVNFLEPAYEFKMKIPFDLTPRDLFQKDPFKMMDVFTQWDPGCKYKDFNNWVGWHRDFGCITGLNRAIYFKPSGEPYEGVKSGLLIRNKD
ncbi:MAG: hypothetical protein ACKO96_28175, partial [Flammeovirgaceae bacterium]